MERTSNRPLLCPQIIGRTFELSALSLLVEQARGGRGQIALITGEAGIGKSRLVTELKAITADQGFLVVQGACFPADHACPYAPVLELVRSLFATCPPERLEASLTVLAPILFPLLPDLIPPPADHAALPPLDPEQAKRRLEALLTQLFLNLTVRTPLLLIVEDLHWSDASSLDFLHYLARRCGTHPLLLVLTCRSEETHPGPNALLTHLNRERLAQEYALARLTEAEVNAMLQAILQGPHTVQRDLVETVYTYSEGNPFFIEETLKSLIAAEEIFYANGRWEQKQMRELHIPRSVQSAVQQRADQLSESARRVLTFAAVAGRRFDFALLQQLTQYDEQKLLLLMKELIAAQLVVEESVEQFAFRHALTRQAVYADLLVRERKALHRRIADTIEHLYVSSLDAHLADLAYHFFEAGAWQKALEYGHLAGEKAYHLYAPRAVAEQVTRALDAAQHASIAPLATLYRLRGWAYETLGDFEQARLDYETTLRMAQADGASHAEWQALMDLGSLWAERDYTQTGSYFQQSLALASRMDDSLTLARSLNRMGNWHLNIEQPREALQYHQEALTLFQQAHNAHGIAETFDLLGMATALGGDLLQAATYYQQAIALFRELDDRQGLASSLATLMILGEGGGYEIETMVPATTSFAESLYFGELALQTARGIGQRSGEAYALFGLAQYLGPHGEYARAFEMAQASLAIAEQIEHRQWLTGAHWQLGVLYLDLLALPEAQQHLEQALILAQEVGSWNWIRIVSGFLALAYLLQHDLSKAESILATALEADAPMQTIGQRLVWAARAELALARSDPVLALDITDRLIASAANLSNGRVIPRLWKLRGEALVALHREAEAETMLRAAQEAAYEQGLRPLLWRIEVTQGKLYQAQRRQQEAAQAFSTAGTLIEELATNGPDKHLREHFLSQTTTMLPQQRALTPGRAAKQAFGGLTAREREVATLIGKGKSNREIAELLVVGNRTVEAHVSGILSKLGFTSRAQIAVWVHEKGLVQSSE